jgi:hypothetical protein
MLSYSVPDPARLQEIEGEEALPDIIPARCLGRDRELLHDEALVGHGLGDETKERTRVAREERDPSEPTTG